MFASASSAPGSRRYRVLTPELALLTCVLVALIAGATALAAAAPPAAALGTACARLSLRGVFVHALPRSLGGGGGGAVGAAAHLARCAAAYQRAAPGWCLAAFVFTYVSLQALAIPGPLLLSVLAGAVYGPLRAQLLVAACATTGASACFLLSSRLARPLLERAAPARLADLRARIDAHREHLLSYLIFLRLTPLVPNWLVNAASPLLGVPLWTFFVATAIGLAPPNFAHAHTGAALAAGLAGWAGEGVVVGEPVDVVVARAEAAGSGWRALAALGLLQIVALAPPFVKWRLRRRAAAGGAGIRDGGGGVGELGGKGGAAAALRGGSGDDGDGGEAAGVHTLGASAECGAGSSGGGGGSGGGGAHLRAAAAATAALTVAGLHADAL